MYYCLLFLAMVNILWRNLKSATQKIIPICWKNSNHSDFCKNTYDFCYSDFTFKFNDELAVY